MGVPILNPAPMTVEEFFAFTDTRPDEEKWELIDGEPVLNASPAYGHQRLVRNLVGLLTLIEDRDAPGWEVLPGLGVRLSDIRVPEPDALIRPRRTIRGRICDDMTVAFEILSPSTADRDLRWKRQAYRELPTLQSYVVLAQDAVDVVAFDREAGWREQRWNSLEDVLHVRALSLSLPLQALYRGTELAPL